MISASSLTISPDEYIQLALGLGGEGEDSKNFPVVKGDVLLSDSDAGRSVKVLPCAEIFGDIRADSNCRLEEIRASRIHGSLVLDGSRIRDIDKSCTVSGGLWAQGCKNLRGIGGRFDDSVHLSFSSIQELGREFYTLRNLYVNGCMDLKVINCRVGGDLDAQKSGVAEFGSECRISGYIDLSDCDSFREISFIGEVKNAIFDRSGIRRIKEGFICSKSISLSDCPFLREVDRVDTTDLRVVNCPVENIDLTGVSHYLLIDNCPNIRRVLSKPRGEATIIRCPIDSLSGLSGMAGSLWIRQCSKIREISGKWQNNVVLEDLASLGSIEEDFFCRGDLTVSGCPRLERMGGTVGGNFKLASGRRLVTFSPRYHCAGDMVVHGCGGGRSGRGIYFSGKVDGKLSVIGAHAFRMDPDSRVNGDGLFSECTGDCEIRGQVGGHLHIHESEIRSLGADLDCQGKLVVLDCQRLKVLNCRAGGKVVISSNSLERIGPAFFGGGDAEFFLCTKLSLFEGGVAGEVRCDRGEVPFKVNQKPKMGHSPIDTK
jgi:hypothetical protein